jgi:transposase-like protein
MVQFMTQRLMDMDIEGRCGDGYHEKNTERLKSQNGYRERTWDTRAGSVPLKIPKLRQGSYFPEILEPRRTAEKALTAVIQEACFQGISNRSLDDLVKALGVSRVSKSQVSRLWRTNVVGIFPNHGAIVRLVEAMVLEQNDEWNMNRRYMQLEGLQTLCDTSPTRLSGLWTYTTSWDTTLASQGMSFCSPQKHSGFTAVLVTTNFRHTWPDWPRPQQ